MPQETKGFVHLHNEVPVVDIFLLITGFFLRLLYSKLVAHIMKCCFIRMLLLFFVCFSSEFILLSAQPSDTLAVEVISFFLPNNNFCFHVTKGEVMVVIHLTSQPTRGEALKSLPGTFRIVIRFFKSYR